MARIFISHSSRDNAHAIAFAEWLSEQGWNDYFLDVDRHPDRAIAPGERWERALVEAAHRCQAVIFLVSEAWLASDWCLEELHLAHGLNNAFFTFVAP